MFSVCWRDASGMVAAALPSVATSAVWFVGGFGRRRGMRTVRHVSTSNSSTNSSTSSSTSDALGDEFGLASEAEFARPRTAGVRGKVTRPGKGDVLMVGIKADGSTKRWYDSVVVEEVRGSALEDVVRTSAENESTTDADAVTRRYAIKLGGRFVRTPLRKRLEMPSRLLAEALAIEWDSQLVEVRPTSMPILHLVTVAIDQTSLEPDKYADNLKRFVETDAICHWSESPQKLANLQKKYWTPLLEWADDTHGIKLDSAVHLLHSQPEESVQRMMDIMKRMDPWRLAAYDTLVTTTKSAVISLALFDGHISVDHAYRAARLEEDFQISEWGKVKGVFGHGIDMEWVRLKLACARAVLSMLEADDC